MKAVTEFASFQLTAALQAKAALTAEGKSPEEMQASLGEKYKLEGEKLGHFMQALEVAGSNPEKLRRVLVVKLNEGESVPAKAVKVEDTYYVPEFLSMPTPKAAEEGGRGGRGGRGGKGGPRKGGRGDGPKGSPWGLSPEEKAAKKGGGSKPQ